MTQGGYSTVTKANEVNSHQDFNSNYGSGNVPSGGNILSGGGYVPSGGGYVPSGGGGGYVPLGASKPNLIGSRNSSTRPNYAEVPKPNLVAAPKPAPGSFLARQAAAMQP